MIRKKKTSSARLLSSERGQALVMVLIFLVLGSLTLMPLLSYLGTTFQAGGLYQNKTDHLYAADSGIEDAIWQIKYDRLESLFTDPAYDCYDYSTTWTYELDEPLNKQDATVSIRNVWIPEDIPPPGKIEARQIIEANKLIVTGNAPGDSTYDIKLSFYPGEEEADALMVESVGIWLPLGFTYHGNCNLAGYEPLEDYYQEPTVSPYKGGQAVVWEFPSANLTAFPGVNPEDTPMLTEITFEYTTSQTDVKPAAIAWILTSGVSDVPISWDADIKIYHITSVSDDTEIEAYTAKCELRKMGAAIAGDYRAFGNSLMIDTNYDWWEIRDELLDSSDAEVTDIPSDAEAIAAYLYWSGWFDEESEQIVWEDDCSNFNDWQHLGGVWGLQQGSFRGYYHGSISDEHRYLAMKYSQYLSECAPSSAKVGWEHWENGHLESSDALKFQFSGDGGASWSNKITAFADDIGGSPRDFSYTIPTAYLTDNFKMRFYLQGFTDDDEYCFVDNFYIIKDRADMADTTVIFKINGVQVYLDEQGDPQTGDEEITASDWATLENQTDQYSYACHRDVTKLVQEYSNLGDNENHTGNGLYTVGGVDADTGEHWSYAGWSLIIIYTSPETAGHQLYLYDTFAWARENQNLDFDGDGEDGGSITGFVVPEPVEGEVNAATLTCFVAEGDGWLPGDKLLFNSTKLSDGDGSDENVWDSESIGMTEDGMDIDTFYVTWASHLLEPGDTTAQLDLPTGTDNWNLIYIILSLRSKTIIGGTTHYVLISQ